MPTDTSITIAYGFLCRGTVGTACCACLGAAAGAFGGIVEFCIELSL